MNKISSAQEYEELKNLKAHIYGFLLWLSIIHRLFMDF